MVILGTDDEKIHFIAYDKNETHRIEKWYSVDHKFTVDKEGNINMDELYENITVE